MKRFRQEAILILKLLFVNVVVLLRIVILVRYFLTSLVSFAKFIHHIYVYTKSENKNTLEIINLKGS